MSGDLDRFKEHIPLLEYLQRHNWRGHRAGTGPEFVGLCPLHPETRPSFYVNTSKNLFFCHGCGRGGDLIRFVELFQHLSFRKSMDHLEQVLAALARSRSVSQLLAHAAAFYQLELHRHPEAAQYLERRGLHDSTLVEDLGLGYARGGNLRRHLSGLGYSLDHLLQVGLITPQGRDTFCRRVIFPCREPDGQIVNLYGRSIGTAFPHRLLPRSKGSLFAWDSVRHFTTVILVEGLFDLAVLWQAGFRNTTCAIGTYLSSAHLAQLSDPPGRAVYIAFDQDDNQAGQRAAHQLALHLKGLGFPAHIIYLPQGQDPNSYFVAGATAADFTACLERAQLL